MNQQACPNCHSLEFLQAEIELQIQFSTRKSDMVEVRQTEPCCKSCNWVPSDELKDVAVTRKMLIPGLPSYSNVLNN